MTGEWQDISTDDIIERVAQLQVDCGDGSTMGLRFIIALGLQEQSRLDDMQDELSNTDALKVAYDAIRAALSAIDASGTHVVVPVVPTDAMTEAGLDDPDAGYCDRCSQSGFVRNSGYPDVIWRAMLKASQEEGQ